MFSFIGKAIILLAILALAVNLWPLIPIALIGRFLYFMAKTD